MAKESYYLIVAAVLLALIAFVPQLLRFRISILRKFRWTWLADLHERNFIGFVMAVRIIILAIAVVLVVLAFSRQVGV